MYIKISSKPLYSHWPSVAQKRILEFVVLSGYIAVDTLETYKKRKGKEFSVLHLKKSVKKLPFRETSQYVST